LTGLFNADFPLFIELSADVAAALSIGPMNNEKMGALSNVDLSLFVELNAALAATFVNRPTEH
jgi:hypothetical protein